MTTAITKEQRERLASFTDRNEMVFSKILVFPDSEDERRMWLSVSGIDVVRSYESLVVDLESRLKTMTEMCYEESEKVKSLEAKLYDCERRLGPAGYKMLEELRESRTKLSKCKGALLWIGMNSGIAADGNHIDPMRAHKENGERVDKTLSEVWGNE